MSAKSFRRLFADGHGVVIPMIQRDYAQGRTDGRSQAVLSAFLDSLHAALTNPDAKPLDLDFVYGRWDQNASALEPLDGQQRLTTLFLLHWYLAQQDGRQPSFRAWIQSSGKSRFRYRTRPSAEEFIDALVNEDVELAELPNTEEALSTWISDRPWFLRAWNRDPTVSACLSTLDAIRAKFHDLDDGFDNLAGDDDPRVIFHELRLGDFGLSDDLYVKMNARGKPLTTFEVFKAELEQSIEALFSEELCKHDRSKTWKQYTSERIDREWTDFLWHHRDERDTIDSRFLQLMRLVMLIHCALRAAPDDDQLDEQIERLLLEPEPSIRFFEGELKCLDRDFVERLVILMDALAGSPAGKLGVLACADYFDENAALEALFGPGKGRFGLSTSDWAKLSAYGMFLIARADDLRVEGRVACHDWMRVVCNLVNNSGIDRIERLPAALQSFAAAHEDGARAGFLRHVADGEVLGQGFSREQREEERIKARLILSKPSWREVIERAEMHAYLRGDLRFLLRASRIWEVRSTTTSCDLSDSDHEGLQHSFQHWYERVCAVFPPNQSGLVQLGDPQKSEYLWERALLCHGDYLLPSLRNMCLVNDGDRDPRWKRLLQADGKREIIERVLEQVDLGDVATSLRKIIVAGPPEGTRFWQRILIREPRTIAACTKRMLRFEDDTVYLLHTTQRNGYHVDLYVYALYLLAVDRAPVDFEQPRPPEVRGGGGRSTLTLTRTDATASVSVRTEQAQQVFRLTSAECWSDAITQAGWQQEANGWVRRVPLERGEEQLLAFLGSFAGPPNLD